MLIISAVLYLFYHSAFLCVLGTGFVPVYVGYRKKQLVKKRKKRLSVEFREGIRCLTAAMQAGYSVEQAWQDSVTELEMLLGKNSLIAEEFRYIESNMELNVTIEQLLDDFGERSGVEDIQSFTVIFRTAKRSGGNFVGIMDRTARNITEKQEVYQEIETVLAAKKLEQRVMSVIPFGIILYTQFSFPGFTDVLYGNPAGRLIMSICLAIYIVAFCLGNRMVEVEI